MAWSRPYLKPCHTLFELTSTTRNVDGRLCEGKNMDYLMRCIQGFSCFFYLLPDNKQTVE